MLSLIIPVYKNEDNIRPLLEAIKTISDQIDDDFEAVFVVDGSPDGSFLALREGLPKAGFAAQLIALSRNFGAFAAIRAGLEKASGDIFTVMAADLQEPPELIVKMHAALKAGSCDVAYGERIKREDPWIPRMLSQLFWSFYRRNVAPDIPRGGVDIFGCTRAVRDQMLALEERNSSLVALLFWVGFRRQAFPYKRRAREVGTSAWTFLKKWRYMQDSIFSFSDLPISWLLGVGFFGTLLSIIFAVVVFVSALLGQIDVPGYAATIIVILIFGTIQLLSIGILGIYTWRVFENTKGRPLHIVMSSETFYAQSKSETTLHKELVNMESSISAPVEGPSSLRMRLVNTQDSAYIYSLRMDPAYNTYLSPVSGGDKAQAAWIERYKQDEAAGKQYYFIIERKDGQACGLVRLYEIQSLQFTWGSWILDKNKPAKAALESAFLIYDIAFNHLSLRLAVFEVMRENTHTLAFHRRFGARETGMDDTNVYFDYSVEQFQSDQFKFIDALRTNS